MFKAIRHNKVGILYAVLFFAVIMMVASACSVQTNCGTSKRGMKSAHKTWNR